MTTNEMARAMILQMPGVLNTEAASDLRAVIQYEISTPLYQVIDHGVMTVFEGRHDAPDVTIIMQDAHLVALFNGELGGFKAFVTGKLKVKGDVNLARRLPGLVDQKKVARLKAQNS